MGAGMKASELPDSMLKLVEKSQRQALGLRTMDEIAAQAEVKIEKDLHRQIENLLRIRNVQFFSSRMDRRTTTQVGTPDILFCVLVWVFDKLTQSTFQMPQAHAWELKIGGRALDPEQVKMFEQMTAKPNGWTCRTIRSVDDALAELKRLGL
jgi:hypothetical protein